MKIVERIKIAIREFFGREEYAKRFYMTVVAVCAVSSAAILGGILFSWLNAQGGTAEVPEMPARESAPAQSYIGTPLGAGRTGDPVTIEVGEQTAASLIQRTLEQKIKLEQIEVKFSAPDLFWVSGYVLKESADIYMNGDNSPLLSAGLALAPESVYVEMEFNIAFDAADRRITASPLTLKVSDIDITGFIPDSVVTAANEAINYAVPESAGISGISVQDGRIVFEVGI